MARCRFVLLLCCRPRWCKMSEDPPHTHLRHSVCCVVVVGVPSSAGLPFIDIVCQQRIRTEVTFPAYVRLLHIFFSAYKTNRSRRRFSASTAFSSRRIMSCLGGEEEPIHLG
ncbi:hypothetical protein M426DRAFT_189722 [Hypoxylon sp. CI-4A]|nr:hypothetical protein M426DRAFT_189722 [Hypoxylon sp. CI-4A]